MQPKVAIALLLLLACGEDAPEETTPGQPQIARYYSEPAPANIKTHLGRHFIERGNDLQKMKLLGPVQSLHQIRFTEKTFSSDLFSLANHRILLSKCTEHEKTTFINGTGMMSGYTRFYGSSWRPAIEMVYTYDINNDLQKCLIVDHENKDTTWQFSSYKDHLLVQRTSGTDKSLYTHDEQGRLIREEHFNDGKIHITTNYTYNLATNFRYTRREVNHMTYESESAYDDHGNLLYEQLKKFEWTDQVVSEYDSLDHVILQYTIDGETGDLTDSTTFGYAYDKYGNWVRQVKFRNNQPFEMIIRELEYYDEP